MNTTHSSSASVSSPAASQEATPAAATKTASAKVPAKKTAASNVKAGLATKPAKSKKEKVATPAAKPAAAPPKAAAAAKEAKEAKAKKPKLVRDSFTIPKNEYTVLEDLKMRAAKLGRPAKKSEVLRAGVMALAAMGDAAFLASVSGVPAVKTGRPAKSEA